MLTTLYLSGEIGHRFGRKHKLAVASPAEAIRAIEANHPGFAAYLIAAGDRGVDFRVKVDGEVIGEDRVRFERPGKTIRISPVIAGRKSGTGQLIAGIALVALAVVAQQYQLLPYTWSMVGTAGWASATSMVGGLGLSMAIGGISQMLSPMPKGPQLSEGKPSYIFNGPVNTVEQGGPVPLCYGFCLVGSRMISTAMDADDTPAPIAAPSPDDAGEGPATTDPEYPTTPGTATATNLRGRSLQTRQNLRQIHLLSEGEVEGICDAAGNLLGTEERNKGILLDETPIQNADGSFPQKDKEVTTAFRAGLASQGWLAGFPSAESEVSVDTKVIKGSDKWANAVQREIPAGSHNALRVTLRFPALYEIDNKGNRTGSAVHLGIQVKRVAEAEWHYPVGGHLLPNGEIDGLIQGEATQPYLRSFRIPLEGTGPWLVSVARESADSTDPTKIQNDLYWHSYTKITDEKFTYRHSAILGVSYSAERSNSAAAVAVRLKGIKVRVPSNYDPVTRNYAGTWDGQFAGAPITLSVGHGAGDATLGIAPLAADLPLNSPIELYAGTTVHRAYLTAAAIAGTTSLAITPINAVIPGGTTGYGFHLQWTNNPAWIYYDLSTHPRYGLGQYIADAALDKWALYEISRYCDGVDGSGSFVGVPTGLDDASREPRFTCNTYIQSTADAYQVLSDLSSCFRGMIYWGNGFITAVQDTPKIPRFSFTDANVIDGVFNFSSTAAKARHTVCYVQWNDPGDSYAAKFEEVQDDQGIEDLGVRPITIVAFGCTSRGQAKRAGQWKLLTERLENDTVTFRTGMEGARARPGDICRVSARFKTTNRMYGRLTAVGAGTLTLDAPAVITGSDWTLFVTRQDGTQIELDVENGAGTHSTLTVTGDLAGIVPNAVFILRSPALEPALYRVLNVKELEPKRYEITALLYNESKFAAIEEGLQIVVPPTSDLPPAEAPAAPATLEFRESFVDTASGTQRFLTATWSPSPSWFTKDYVVEYRGPNGEWKLLGETTALSAPPVLVTALGDHSFRVFARSPFKLLSPAKTGTYTLGEVSDPDQPTSLQIVPQGQGFFLTWLNPASPNLTVIEIQESLDGTFNDPPAAPSPIIGTAAADKGLKGAFHRGGVTADFHRWYRIRARNASSGKSTWTASVNATATVPPPGDSVQIQYSVDGATDWHDTFTTGDRYMRQRIGDGEWSSAIRIIGDDGVRGSRSFVRELTGGPGWSEAELASQAEAAITSYGMTKTALDTVTLYKPAAGEFLGFSATRFWNPTTSTWDPVEQVIDGNLIVHGTIGADQIVAGVSLTAPLIEGGRLILKDSCTICAYPGAEEDENADTGLVRMNGGGGPNTTIPGERGGQIDCFGNEYPTADAAGSILLTPGAAETGSIQLRDRTGTNRIVVNPDGTVTISGLVPTAGDIGVFMAASYGASPAVTATENAAAIQAAIDAAGDAGGGSVLLPPGVLLCNPIHTTAKNVTLFSHGGTTLKASDKYSTFIRIRHSGCQLKGFTIDGNRGATELDLGEDGYYATLHVESAGAQVRDVRLLDLSIVHCLNIGVIFFGDVLNCEASFCRFDDFFCALQTNTNTDGNPHRVLMFNNEFRNCYLPAETNFTGAIKISRNPAIHSSNGGEHIVKGNRTYNAGQVGIELFGRGGEDSLVEANIVDGSRFGISLDNASRSVVLGNRVSRFTFLGIELASSCNHCEIIGNVVIGDLGTQQVETATVAGLISVAGNAKVTVTSAAITGSPVEVEVPVEGGDNPAAIAGKIRAALWHNLAINSAFEIRSGPDAADVVLAAKYSTLNDSTLNIAIANDTCAGITAAPVSVATTAGVAPGFTGSAVSSSNVGIANNKITGNYFAGVHGAHAVHVAGGSNYSITDNQFFDCDGTCNIQATTHVSIKHNLFTRIRNGGIFLDLGDNDGRSFQPAENYEVVGNTWMDNAANAYALIQIYDAGHGNDVRNVTISDNKFMDSRYTFGILNLDAMAGRLINYVCERNTGSVAGDAFATLNPTQSDYVGLPFAQSAFGFGHAFEYKTALHVPVSEEESRWYKLMVVHSGQVANFLFGVEYVLDGAQRRDVFQVSAVPYDGGTHAINKVSGSHSGPTVLTEIIYNGVAERHEIWVKLRATETAGTINFYFSKIADHPTAKFVIQEPVAETAEPGWGNVLKIDPDGYEDPAAAIAFGSSFKKKWTLTLPNSADPLWVKIWSVDFGDVVALHLALENSQTGGDRSRKTICFITGSPYGQDASITLYPGAYRNGVVVEEVIYNNKDDGSIQEIWLKLAPNPGGPLTLWLSDKIEGVVSVPEFVAGEDLPAWATNHYRAKWETLASEMVTRALRTYDMLVSAPFGIGGEPHARLWVRGGTTGGFADRVARLEDDEGNPLLELKENGDTISHHGKFAVQPTDGFLNECGLVVEKGTISLASDGSNDRWCKVLSADYGRPLNFELLLQEEGGDARSRSRFLCAGGVYGWGNSITRMPEPYHNAGNVLEVAMHTPSSGATTELWIRIRPVAAAMTVHFWLIGHPGGLIAAPTSQTTEPTWGDGPLYRCGKEVYYQGLELPAVIARWGLFSGPSGALTYPPRARLWIKGTAEHDGDAERIALFEDDDGVSQLDVREDGVRTRNQEIAEDLNVGGVIKIDGVQVIGPQQSSPGDGATNGATDAANDAPTNAATSATYDGTDTVHKADVTTALNTLGAKANAQATRLNNQANKYNDLAAKYNDLAGKFNTLLDKLQAHGLLG